MTRQRCGQGGAFRNSTGAPSPSLSPGMPITPNALVFFSRAIEITHFPTGPKNWLFRRVSLFPLRPIISIRDLDSRICRGRPYPPTFTYAERICSFAKNFLSSHCPIIESYDFFIYFRHHLMIAQRDEISYI